MGQLSCNKPETFISRTSIRTSALIKLPTLSQSEAAKRIQRTWRSIRARKRVALLRPVLPYHYLSLTEISETLSSRHFTSKREKKPIYVYKDGSFYSGQWRGGFRDGKGVMVWADGAHYEGNWALGRMSGIGKFVMVEGFEFEGNWAKYKLPSRQGPHSDGYMWLWFKCRQREMELLDITDESKLRAYDSLFDRFSGLVTEITGILERLPFVISRSKIRSKTFTDGSVYEGELRHGKCHGVGRCSNGGRLVYEGMWKDDSRHGVGRLIGTDGSIYEGTFVEGLKEGFGICVWLSHNRYLGMWLHDKMEGIGQFEWSSVKNYRGEWTAGYQSGFGVLTDRRSRRIGTWLKGRLG